MQKAVYPGSFDPITLGHVDIIQRLARVFDEVVVLVAHSSGKQSLFSVQERLELIGKSLPPGLNVRLDSFEGLTTDYMKKSGIRVIARGLRAVSDYEYEMTMAHMNKKLYAECETLFMPSAPHLTFISSRGVKEVAMNGGALEDFLPKAIQSDLLNKLLEREKP